MRIRAVSAKRHVQGELQGQVAELLAPDAFGGELSGTPPRCIAQLLRQRTRRLPELPDEEERVTEMCKHCHAMSTVVLWGRMGN